MSLLTPKLPLFLFARFSFPYMVPIFFLKTFVIWLLTTMPLMHVCCMIFSTTAAKVYSPIPSPSLWQSCKEDSWKIDKNNRYLTYSRLSSNKILILYEIPYLWEQKEKIQIPQFIYETTYLLILHVNESNEWPGNPVFGPSDISPAAFTDPQKTRSKTSESSPTWAAIWPI